MPVDLFKEFNIFPKNETDWKRQLDIHRRHDMLLVMKNIPQEQIPAQWAHAMSCPWTISSVEPILLSNWFLQFRERILKSLDSIFHAFPLSVFPMEICYQIGSYLMITDLFRLSLVSRQFLRLFLSDPLLGSIQTFKVYENDRIAFLQVHDRMSNIRKLCLRRLNHAWDIFRASESWAENLVSLEITVASIRGPRQDLVCKLPNLKVLLFRRNNSGGSDFFLEAILNQCLETSVMWLEFYSLDRIFLEKAPGLPKLEHLIMNSSSCVSSDSCLFLKWISSHSSIKRLCLRAGAEGIKRELFPSHLELCYPCRCKLEYLDI